MGGISRFGAFAAASVLLALPSLGPAVAGPRLSDSGSDEVGIIIEGPGYGGTADELAVSWVDLPVSHAAGRMGVRPLIGAGPRTEDGGPANPELLETGDTQVGLAIMGVGFRGKSAVVVRVGESDPVDLRTDATGTLAVQVTGVPARAAMPGMSVVAIGRSPSGTTRTLVGAVPPRPNGLAPSDLIPWLAAGAGLLALGWQVHARRRRSSIDQELALDERTAEPSAV